MYNSYFCVCLAHIPLFLYPFLHTTSKTRPFEYLRLTSLGVVGALVKVSLVCFPEARH
jgi:CCR4-NOT transcription complex subunit 9